MFSTFFQNEIKLNFNFSNHYKSFFKMAGALVPFHQLPPPPFQWTVNAAIQLIIERRNLHWQFERLANRDHQNVWTLISNRLFAATGFVATAINVETNGTPSKEGTKIR